MESNIKEEWGRTPYGKLQDDWPKDENGDFEEPVFLKHCASTDMEDDLLVNMLAAYGIPCIRQYPNNGQLGRSMKGFFYAFYLLHIWLLYILAWFMGVRY